MKLPGLELPYIPGFHPLPWRVDPEDACAVIDAEGAVVDDWLWSETTKWLAAGPDLAAALVDVTDSLVAALEVHAPDINPSEHAAVRKALAALAKARGEA